MGQGNTLEPEQPLGKSFSKPELEQLLPSDGRQSKHRWSSLTAGRSPKFPAGITMRLNLPRTNTKKVDQMYLYYEATLWQALA